MHTTATGMETLLNINHDKIIHLVELTPMKIQIRKLAGFTGIKVLEKCTEVNQFLEKLAKIE